MIFESPVIKFLMFGLLVSLVIEPAQFLNQSLIVLAHTQRLINLHAYLLNLTGFSPEHSQLFINNHSLRVRSFIKC